MVKPGSLSKEYTYPGGHYGPTVATYNGLTVIACLKCYYRHLYPLPDHAILTRFYADPDGFYHGSERRFKIDADHHHRGLWDSLYRWEASRLFTYLGPATRMIDLGAGTGWFVKWWADNIGRAVGVEPATVARSYSPVPDRLFPTIPMAARKFAAGNPVYLRARLVLEHLADPVGFLREAVGIPQQVKGIIIHVPNEWNPLQNRIARGGVGSWFIDKTHINYFDRRGLECVLREAGFEPLSWYATYPLELWQLAGVRYIGDEVKGQWVHLSRLKFEKVFGNLSFKLYKLLFDRLGWGREIICIAKINDK